MFRLPDEDLIEELRDHEFAHAYIEDQANLRIAAQVRALRQQRGWTQEQLAARAGLKQSRVSKLEGADFESVTLTTLRKLAQAFDVHADVSFCSVGSALIDFANLSKETLEVEDREHSLDSVVELRADGAFVASAPVDQAATYSSTAGASTQSHNLFASFTVPA